MTAMVNTPVTPGCIVNTKYVGPNERLNGKACMARETGKDMVEVKFSDDMTGMHLAWHPVPRNELEYWAPRV